MERIDGAAPSVEKVAIPSREALTGQEDLVSVVVKVRWADLVALDELQTGEMEKLGVRPERSEIIRRAIQFYYEKRQGVII